MNLLRIKDLDINKIIDAQICRAKEVRCKVVNADEMTFDDEWEPEYKVFQQKTKPKRMLVYPKYMYLIHLIIRGCIESNEGVTYLPVETYYPIFGRQLSEMLYTMEDMGIIAIGCYTVGKHSRAIRLLKWNIEEYVNVNKKVALLVKKMALNKSKTVRQKYTKELKSNIDDIKFIDNYNDSLELVRMMNKEAAVKYVNDNIEKETHRYYHYLYSIDSINKEKKITSISEYNQRMYHPIANYPKVLRRYLNFRYQVDVHNSHPLLVNRFLMSKYHIQYKIIKEMINNEILYRYHNDCQKLCKLLKHNRLWKDEVKDVPKDVLLYIYCTSTGLIWDMFVNRFGMNRDDVKVTMFREVFYSYSTTTKNKQHAKKFVELFPHVWTQIREMKKHYTDKSKPHANMANKMMEIESFIMIEILKEFFAAGFKVISIHDAIYVIDDAANDGLKVDDAVNMMLAIYDKHKLCPSIDVEKYESV